jgi:hypothetical protein
MPLPKLIELDLPSSVARIPLPPEAEIDDILVMAVDGRISWARIRPETHHWSDLYWAVAAKAANITDGLWVVSGVESIEGSTVATPSPPGWNA